MSKKLEIMRALTDLLERTPDYPKLEGQVYRGRKFFGANEIDDYAMSIMEAPRPSIGQGAGRDDQVRQMQWTLNVQGWPVDDKVNPSDPAYEMAEAVERQLDRIIAVKPVDPTSGMGGDPTYPTDYLLGHRITSITIADSVVLPAQDNLSRFAFFYIPIILTIVKAPRN